MVASIVSSKMIEAMARVEGFEFVACLTGTSDAKQLHHPSPHDVDVGFKFIGNTAIDLVQKGYEVPFGYEEALGYMFGSDIRDKDGVAATVGIDSLV
jgi:phosphomannomutase